MIKKYIQPKSIIIARVVVLIVAVALWIGRDPIRTYLFNVTGEEALLSQISGGTQYALTRLQPPLQTADDVFIKHAGMNPYGVNTFLQNEVEPAKREEAIRLISEAGIRWIRQEFPWEDVEIHGKDDFEDRRHEPYKSAWEKYDHIVDLANKYDVQIMARLSNPPTWTRALTNTVGSFAPPDDFTDYGDFVEAVATRYQGRITAYQIWNEPNIFPEWGTYDISAQEYTELLKEGYTRVKAVDPDAIVVMGALAATIELDRVRRYDPNGGVASPGGLSDVLFLQQMYDAGAAPYFDVLAMQGYGLWSGPTDRRMQPRVLNFSRPLYIRDVMVRNGDAHKAIWLSEMGWNAVPPDSGIPQIYGQVSEAQQGRYAALAYQRMQKEWPWLGVGFYWFFKQADERERANNPQYYFRMVEPDFTLLPVYDAIKTQANQTPTLYAGPRKADHWAVNYQGSWELERHDQATLGQVLSGEAGDIATFTFVGNHLEAVVWGEGQLQVTIDQGQPKQIGFDQTESPLILATNLAAQPHAVQLEVVEGTLLLEGYRVGTQQSLLYNRAGSLLMVLATLIGGWVVWLRRGQATQSSSAVTSGKSDVS